MNLQEIAIFKRFMGQHELRKNFIKKYRKSIGMTRNPESIEQYFSNVEPEKVISSAVKHFITNEAMGYDFWQSVDMSWQAYLVKLRASHTIEQESPEKLRGYFAALRENWDNDKPWVYEPISLAQIRYGLITPEEAGLDDKDEEPAQGENEQNDAPLVDFSEEGYDPLADFDFFEEEHTRFLRLMDDEVSLNFNNGSFKITFNMPVSKEIEKSGMECVRLAKSKDGEICLILNRSQGARLSKTTGKNKFNTTINSKDICNKIRTLLDIKPDYSVLKIGQLKSTSDYLIYKVTKQ